MTAADQTSHATRAERAQVRVADLKRQNGLLLAQAEEHWDHRQRSEARVAELEQEVERLRDRALGDEQCCLDTCDGGACETCLGCAAGWCVNGHDFATDPDVWEQMMSEEDHQQWFDVAREHNRGIDAALIRAETAEARARRAVDALRELRDNTKHSAMQRAIIDRALSAADQTSDATPSDTTTKED